MRNRQDITHTGHADKPLWTQEEAIAYECARETMNDMVAICSSRIAKEKKKANPNLQKIQSLYSQRLKFLKERDLISLHDQETIQKIFKNYGSKIKDYRQGGECPV